MALYTNKFIDPTLNFDDMSLDEQAAFTEYWEKQQEKEKNKKRVDLVKKRGTLAARGRGLLDQELFIEDQNIEEEPRRKEEELRRKENSRSIINKPIKIIRNKQLEFTFDTKQTELSNKQFKFQLDRNLKNIQRIMITSVTVTGFAFGNYPDDILFLAQLFKISNTPVSHSNTRTSLNLFEQKMTFFFKGDSVPNISKYNEGGSEYGSVSSGDAGRHLVYHEQFNTPIQVNDTEIDNMTQLVIQFYRENGTDMLTAHNLQFNPVELNVNVYVDPILEENNALFSVVGNGNNMIDFTEGGLFTRVAYITPNIYAKVGNNLIEIDEGSGEVTIAMSSGLYESMTDLASNLQIAINNSSLTYLYTVTYSDSTQKITISTLGSETFSILWSTGTYGAPGGTYNYSLAAVLGFTVDVSGTFTYTGTTAPLTESIQIYGSIGYAISEAMNKNSLNTYICYFNAQPDYKTTDADQSYFRIETSGSVDFSLLLSTGQNANINFAKLLGFSENQRNYDLNNTDFDPSTNIIAEGKFATDITDNTYVPYVNSSNQNPYWRCIMKGYMILGDNGEKDEKDNKR